jgi:putative aminopeptidase FrvX
MCRGNDPTHKQKKKKKKKQQIKTHDIYIDGSCDITRSKDNRVEK